MMRMLTYSKVVCYAPTFSSYTVMTVLCIHYSMFQELQAVNDNLLMCCGCSGLSDPLLHEGTAAYTHLTHFHAASHKQMCDVLCQVCECRMCNMHFHACCAIPGHSSDVELFVSVKLYHSSTIATHAHTRAAGFWGWWGHVVRGEVAVCVQGLTAGSFCVIGAVCVLSRHLKCAVLPGLLQPTDELLPQTGEV